MYYDIFGIRTTPANHNHNVEKWQAEKHWDGAGWRIGSCRARTNLWTAQDPQTPRPLLEDLSLKQEQIARGKGD